MTYSGLHSSLNVITRYHQQQFKVWVYTCLSQFFTSGVSVIFWRQLAQNQVRSLGLGESCLKPSWTNMPRASWAAFWVLCSPGSLDSVLMFPFIVTHRVMGRELMDYSHLAHFDLFDSSESLKSQSLTRKHQILSKSNGLTAVVLAMG